jgi:putative membrane protein
VTQVHVHPGPGLTEPVTAAAALLLAAAYLLGAARLRLRGDVWPWPRDVSFVAGSAALAWAVLGGLPGGPFTAHVAQHVIVGMIAPLLLVLARPLTLALRSLPPGHVRRSLLAMAHSRLAGLVFPPVAALVDVGGLWLLYHTGLFAATRHQPLAHAVLHAHMLAAGLMFTFAVCQLDPVRRRWSLAVRGTALLAAGTAHTTLAKSLYAASPPRTAFTSTDLHAGAQLMYYGGDLVEVALAAALAVQWYKATGRARVSRRVRHDRPCEPGGPRCSAHMASRGVKDQR